jgi:hypothetical protein
MSPANELAKKWCERNPKWQRICDIDDSDSLTLKWSEIPQRDRDRWEHMYPYASEAAWQEFSTGKPTRHRRGHIGEDGQFYDCITDVPRMMNTMMVFQTGGKPGIYYRGGKFEKTSRRKVSAATTEHTKENKQCM